MPPSAELPAIDEAMLELTLGSGEGERGIDPAGMVLGSKAGDEPAEMDCLRIDLKASEAEAAIL